MSTSLDLLEKAVASLSESLILYNSISEPTAAAKIAFRDACIQRFEYSLELSWKTSMKILGSNTLAAKPAVREMARNNLIDMPELWLEFVDARNNTSHTYSENVAIKVFEKVQQFFPEAQKLILKLKQIS